MNIPTSQNNPGDLKVNGQIGTFASPAAGQAALYNDLYAKMSGTSTTGLNGKSTLYEFAQKYAPSSDKNNPAQYAANLANQLKVSPDTAIGTLMPRIDDFAKAVSTNEGYQAPQSDNQSGSELATQPQSPTQTPSQDNTQTTKLFGSQGISDFATGAGRGALSLAEDASKAGDWIARNTVGRLMNGGNAPTPSNSLANAVGGQSNLSNLETAQNPTEEFGKLGSELALTSGAGRLLGLVGSGTKSALMSKPVVELLAKDTGIDATKLSAGTIKQSLRTALDSGVLDTKTGTLAEQALKELESAPSQVKSGIGSVLSRIIKGLGYTAVGGDIVDQLANRGKGFLQGVVQKAVQQGQPSTQNTGAFPIAPYKP